MSKILNFIKKFQQLSLKTKIFIIVGVVILGVILFLVFRPKTSKDQFITVEQKSITETVSVTGNTTPIQSVILGFGSSGIVSSVNSAVGQNVYRGQVLAVLDTSDLEAQIKQAEANVSIQQAKLDSLENNSTSSGQTSDSSKYNDSSVTLTLALNSSYLQVEDTIINKVDTFFLNGNSVNPTINISTYNWDEQRSIQDERVALGSTLKKWKNSLLSSDLETTRLIANDALVATRLFLSHLGKIVDNLSSGNSGVSQTQVDSYKNTMNSAEQAVFTAASTLAKAGSTIQDIQAQKAQVLSAKAGVQSLQARLQNSQITAPIDGVVTQFDAKVGQFATPGSALVTIISNNAFEVDALVSEIDIGKIVLNNTVNMTLDAFPNETFLGTVFYIDPAQTTSEGVVGYKIKVSFSKSDIRMKSGLTANIKIETRKKDNTLVLPQYAILQNDDGTFVEVLENKTKKQIPVTLGLQDQDGNVEVLSGVNVGEKVLNIGLKP